MSILHRLMAILVMGIAMAVLAMVAMAAVAIQGQRLMAAQIAAQEVGREVSSLQLLTQEYVLHGAERPAQQWRARMRQLRATMLQFGDQEVPGEVTLSAIDSRIDDLERTFLELQGAQESTDARLTGLRRDLLVERIIASSQELVELRLEWARVVSDAEEANMRRLVYVVPFALVVMLFICGLMVWTVQRHVLIPLARLQAAARTIQAGNLAVRVGSDTPDELGMASRAVDDMAQSLLEAHARERAEVATRAAAQQRLRHLMDASPLGVFTTDLKGICTYANPALCRLLGRDEAQVLGTGLRSALHPDDAQEMLAKRERALRVPGPQISEHRMITADRRVRWMRGHVALTRSDDDPGTFIGILEDIDERRRYDLALAAKSAELARSNQDLERFAYVVSHDLQEPLRMVISYGQLLRKRHLSRLDSEGAEFLDYMVDGGHRALSLVRDLLSLARLDSQARAPTRVCLQTLLDETRIQLQEAIDGCQARITSDPLPFVTGDRVQLAQLFSNLVGNALKFRGAEPPTLHIGAHQAHGHWHLSFRDNGIGIDPKHFDRIFVMFQRLHLRSQHPGNGIGLSICKRVAERHGGSIHVESTPGQGTTFHVTLIDGDTAPLAFETATAIPTNPAAHPA